MPPVGNIYDSWNICGCETNIYQHEEDSQKPFSRTNRLEFGIRLFWQSRFSTDGFGHTVRRHMFESEHNGNQHKEWSKKTLPEILELIQYPNIEAHENGILKTYSGYSGNADVFIVIMKTFKDFLDSDSRLLSDKRLQMLQVHEIDLDSKYEQTIQIPPNLSPALVAGNNQ
jgi:hypothetical protein